MCRIAAYAGADAPLSRILYDPPRSLEVLAYDPAEQQSGNVNVDGTGIVWFDGRSPQPLRYRTQASPWADQNLAELAPRLRGSHMLGCVRGATPGLPHGTPFVHPFVVGGLAGVHNGWISDFRRRVARPLLAEVSDEVFGQLDGMSDTNALFLLAVDAHRDGADLLEAARTAVERTVKVCERLDATATLTLALADHSGAVCVNAAIGRPANSLHAISDVDGHLFASEPLDPTKTWTAVPQGAAVRLTSDAMEIIT